MREGFEFYLIRASEARSEAAEATLTNTRNRALRSEATWLKLADLAKKVEADRDHVTMESEAPLRNPPQD